MPSPPPISLSALSVAVATKTEINGWWVWDGKDVPTGGFPLLTTVLPWIWCNPSCAFPHATSARVGGGADRDGVWVGLGEREWSSRSSEHLSSNYGARNENKQSPEDPREGFPPFSKCTLSLPSTISLSFPLISRTKEPTITDSKPSEEDMCLKYHMANKTYFTAYPTFNKHIDQCKQKLWPKTPS